MEKLQGRIAPDGVLVQLNCNSFEVGMSLFVPAINLAKLNRQVQKLAEERGWTLTGAERIENGRLGMRFWRVL